MAIMQGYSSPLAAGKNEGLELNFAGLQCFVSLVGRWLRLMMPKHVVQTHRSQKVGIEVRVQMPSGCNVVSQVR